MSNSVSRQLCQYRQPSSRNNLGFDSIQSKESYDGNDVRSHEKFRSAVFAMTISPRDDDDYARRLCSADITSVIRRHLYCEQHRQLFDSSREENSESELTQRYEFSEDESLVNSLESSTSSNSNRRTMLFQRATMTTSCFEKNDKQVNFTDKEACTGSSQLNKTRRIYTKESYNQKDYECTSAETIQSSANACPRVVKPRDILRRPAARKMIIYPPEGQRGQPMTLSKRYSKIQCRVRGNEDTGFRYKVYYLQTFESDKWLPKDKTNSPFRHHDDTDNSTDYDN